MDVVSVAVIAHVSSVATALSANSAPKNVTVPTRHRYPTAHTALRVEVGNTSSVGEIHPVGVRRVRHVHQGTTCSRVTSLPGQTVKNARRALTGSTSQGNATVRLSVPLTETAGPVNPATVPN
jgi:hypothetical protein